MVQFWKTFAQVYNGPDNLEAFNAECKRFAAQQLIDLSCNFDQCKFPKSEEEVLPPAELLADYHRRREALDKQIDKQLDKIQSLLGIDLTV